MERIVQETERRATSIESKCATFEQLYIRPKSTCRLKCAVCVTANLEMNTSLLSSNTQISRRLTKVSGKVDKHCHFMKT